MKEKTVYTAVGIFVVLGFISLLFLAVQVSGVNHFYRKEPEYKLTADFSNIGGLKPQARVSLAGVTVGRVSSIELDTTNYLAIAHIEIFDNSLTIPDDSRLSIMTAGLLGDSYLSFTPGFSDIGIIDGQHLDVSQTISAVVLEDLISKFMSQMANS